MTDSIVVIGKKTVRKTEVPHLEAFARAIHARGKQLVTTRGEAGSVASIVAHAYAEAGGTPQYLSKTTYDEATRGGNVVAFTDTKYVEQLDQVAPDWRDRDWILIHNPKATQEAAAYVTQLVDDLKATA